MQIEKVSVNRLNPAPYNPRRDLCPGDKEYDNLRRSIDEYGCVELIVWNRRTGNVISGHQRLKILREMGFDETDCVVVDLPPEKGKALNLAMNRITGEWDSDMLKDVLEQLDVLDADSLVTGFYEDEIAALLASTSFIEDLANEDFATLNRESDIFSITLNFPIDHKREVDAYVGAVGRAGAARLILDAANRYVLERGDG